MARYTNRNRTLFARQSAPFAGQFATTASCVTTSYVQFKACGFSALRRIFLLVVAVVCLFSPHHSMASNVPGFDAEVKFNVREQSIDAFLSALFQEISVPVSINSELEGAVNGKFDDSARNVFDEIATAFNLIGYYDGAVVQIYRSNEISGKLLPTLAAEARQVVTTAESMGLPDRSNTIATESNGVLVTGTERFIQQIEEIVSSVKALPKKAVPPKVRIVEVERMVSFPDETPMVYQVFKLKHAWATDIQIPIGGQKVVVPGVGTILKELVQNGGSNSSLQSSEASNSVAGLRGEGLSKQPETEDSAQNPDNGPAEAPRIVADSRLNAIIIRDKQNKMSSYKRLIESLDVESGMVEIEATIIDINTDKSRELGVNWRYTGDDVDVLLGQGNATDQSLIPGGGPITAQGRGGILSFGLGEPADFLARISALEQRGAAKVISKPHVITLSDVEAVLAATTEFFVRVAGDEEVDLFNVPVGTTLRVTPHIFRADNKNKIKLLVNIEDGTQSTGASVDNIPVIERSNISTQAVVNEGDSLLVGGLVRETYRNAGDQIPVLGSLPLVGGLFRSKRKQANRVERLFMITPRLASGIGFEKSPGNMALVGNNRSIIEDAEQRISSDDYPQRKGTSYWSEKSRSERADSATYGATVTPGIAEAAVIAPAAKRESVAMNQRTHQAASSGVYAIIDGNQFITPFKVESWSQEKQ